MAVAAEDTVTEGDNTMAGRDGRGPDGRGPLSGRGSGYCSEASYAEGDTGFQPPRRLRIRARNAARGASHGFDRGGGYGRGGRK